MDLYPSLMITWLLVLPASGSQAGLFHAKSTKEKCGFVNTILCAQAEWDSIEDFPEIGG